MFKNWKLNFVLTLVLWNGSIQSLTTFGRMTNQVPTVDLLSTAVQDLNVQMDFLKTNLESINQKISNPTISAPKGLFIPYLPCNFEQQPKICEPNKETIEERSRCQDQITAFMENLTKQNYNLTEKVLKLESLLSRKLDCNVEKLPNSKYYDKHFNCIENCSSPKPSCTKATSSNNSKDGIYLLDIMDSNLKPFYAYCAHEKANDKGWMIIQRREFGSVDFNRNWMDYKNGFGDLNGEYWIGLERLHAITKSVPHKLWIQLQDYNGLKRYAKYSIFSVSNEDEGYKLNVGNYSGDAGDTLQKHNKAKFSTYDNANEDEYFRNCARSYRGGWWYKTCYFCNLNGFYYSASNKNSGNGVNWGGWDGYNNSLKYTHMAIRPYA